MAKSPVRDRVIVYRLLSDGRMKTGTANLHANGLVSDIRDLDNKLMRIPPTAELFLTGRVKTYEHKEGAKIVGWGTVDTTTRARLRDGVIEAARADIQRGTTGSRDRLRRAVEALDKNEKEEKEKTPPATIEVGQIWGNYLGDQRIEVVRIVNSEISYRRVRPAGSEGDILKADVYSFCLMWPVRRK